MRFLLNSHVAFASWREFYSVHGEVLLIRNSITLRGRNAFRLANLKNIFCTLLQLGDMTETPVRKKSFRSAKFNLLMRKYNYWKWFLHTRCAHHIDPSLTCMFHVLGRCTLAFWPFACFVCCMIWLIKSNCWRVNPSLFIPVGELGEGDLELIAVIVLPSPFIWYCMQVAPCGELASPLGDGAEMERKENHVEIKMYGEVYRSCDEALYAKMKNYHSLLLVINWDW